MLRNTVLVIIALLVPLLSQGAEPEFPPGIRHGYPFCIAGPNDTILMSYRVEKTTKVELARSSDAGLT